MNSHKKRKMSLKSSKIDKPCKLRYSQFSMELRMFHTWQQFKSIYSEVMKKILFIALSIILSAPTFGADGNYKKTKMYKTL